MSGSNSSTIGKIKPKQKIHHYVKIGCQIWACYLRWLMEVCVCFSRESLFTVIHRNLKRTNNLTNKKTLSNAFCDVPARALWGECVRARHVCGFEVSFQPHFPFLWSGFPRNTRTNSRDNLRALWKSRYYYFKLTTQSPEPHHVHVSSCGEGVRKWSFLLSFVLVVHED